MTMIPWRHFRFLAAVLTATAFPISGCQVMTSAEEDPPPGEEPPPVPGTPDFSLTVDPASQTVTPSGAAQFNADIQFLNGFESTSITLSTSGEPAGVTVDFDPNPLPHQGRSVLTLTGDGSVAPGLHTVTVSALSEGISKSQDVALDVTAAASFTASISPGAQNVGAGGAVTYDVTVTGLNGFSDPVTLVVTGLPADVTASFSSNPVTPTATSTLTLTTQPSTSPNTYDFTVTATGGSIERTLQGALDVNPPGSAWGINTAGSTGASNNCVIVGPARNDGVARVYVGTVTTGEIFEFTWGGSSWTSLNIGGSNSGEEVHNMGMGAGRGDGVIRIYAGSVDGELYELSWSGSAWTQTTIDATSGPVFHAVVGDGRGDGVTRVYAGRGGSVWEYLWNGSGWDATEVGSVSGVAHGLRLGDGRGDGQPHIYVATTQGGVYEATFSGGSWSIAQIASTQDTRNVNVGAGRGDGVNRVYAARAAGVITEISWNGSSWTTMDINQPVGDVLVHAYFTDGRGDGVTRVYSSGADGNSYEFTWDGSSWSQYTLGGGQNYMYGFDVGFGRNDGVMRLYGASFNNQLYEYSWQ